MTSYFQPVDETRPGITSHVKQTHDAGQSSEEEKYLRERVEELENEVIHLKMDKQAKEHVINQMNLFGLHSPPLAA
jgi:hypothetical protein